MPTVYAEVTAALVKSVAPDPAGGQLFIRDTLTPGFALRVQPSGAKAYIAEFRVKGGRTRRVTLGRVGKLDVAKARTAARGYLGSAALGVDRAAEEREARAEDSAARVVTLARAFESYMEARPLKPTTHRDYRYALDHWLAGWRDRPIADISRQDVLALHRTLEAERGPATANQTMRVLRAVLNYSRAVYETRGGQPLLTTNPVSVLRDAKTWARVKPRDRIIGFTDLPAWWRAVQALGPTMRDYLVALLLTGRRRAEMMNLAWADVDLAAKAILYRDTKNGTDLTVPIGPYLAAMMAERWATRGQGPDGNPCPWVFPARDCAGPLQEPKGAVAAVVATSGVEFSPHDLRRTFITMADGLPGVSSYVLKGLAGHKAQDVTGRVYVQLPVEKLRAPVQTIERHILTAAGAKPRTARRRTPGGAATPATPATRG
jgi:integrase